MKKTNKYAAIFILTFGVLTSTVSGAEAATLRDSAMASANTQKGAKYRYGAEGGYTKGYDCSGLTYWAYKKHGKTIPRTAQSQYNKSKKISSSTRRSGDLIFIRDSRGNVYHVGIFSGVRNGKGYMINANTGSYRGRKVVEAPVTDYTTGSPSAVYGRY